ncbi:Lrp/AsnC family transcriptional regulator [Limosilactobacillus reuteri]|jgi:Lrp/AsnC family leucine-responsive transcriptional regulator|uniref:Lrp/AsnC family transcriptional regulator n=1 Tax=Limosilactobacillus reuteri TaxID=1598 RepID=A0A1X8VAN4_LIMRT|nr:Lrp/AsnC family transcriptional regulator [Limosilactobacillus reuteri]GFI60510.1 HTH-type transcriptional regulator LrpC [Lactobacillaceae bacterium]ANU52040.1 AsnC family transcriptional regulator [Limosilactobacillus reuteri]KGE72576.1 AsnC family transcriptional regulator [Limosilactobacillus reuteri]MBW3350364.1 Lrp/AsnC family transcriptional regulator [Limosilactobacillus reuteri]MCC4330872.1 Lrp/AsnC family transcriptional regulator [Limosilactobacillus reuteri]
MDKIDRKIINLLQKNARASLKELSKECFISSPAIAARINKLERNGIITGYHTSVNMEKINFHVKAFIQVQLEPRQKQEFYPYIQQIPNVIECNCVTGDYSEIMEVVFPSTTDLDDFINTIQQRFGKTSTQIVFSTSVDHRGVKLAPAQDTVSSEKE